MGGLTPLMHLRSLELRIDTGEAVSVLPACISLLGNLRVLKLIAIPRLMCARGWAELPKLETLHLACCGVEGDAEHAFPGMARLLSLSQLTFWNMSNLTSWPSALWCLPQLRVVCYGVQHSARRGRPDPPAPPQAALPAAWSQLPSLQELNLSGQGYRAFPTVVTHLTTLTCLDLTGNCVEVLPAGITALSRLANLALGHRALDGPGVLDVRALGRLTALPRLKRLRLCVCAAVFSAEFAYAADHLALRTLGCLRTLLLRPGRRARPCWHTL